MQLDTRRNPTRTDHFTFNLYSISSFFSSRIICSTTGTELCLITSSTVIEEGKEMVLLKGIRNLLCNRGFTSWIWEKLKERRMKRGIGEMGGRSCAGSCSVSYVFFRVFLAPGSLHLATHFHSLFSFFPLSHSSSDDDPRSPAPSNFMCHWSLSHKMTNRSTWRKESVP